MDKELEDLARALVDQLDKVHNSDEYKGVWGMYFVHGGQYTGPQYANELGALRKYLKEKV